MLSRVSAVATFVWIAEGQLADLQLTWQTYHMTILMQRRVWWFLANVFGIGAFLAFASKAWIEPELANQPGASAGDFIVWGISALPILVIFIIAHIVVGGLAVTKLRLDWALPLVLTTVSWIAAAIFDNMHHGI